MKKTRKFLAFTLSLALVISLLLGAVPISASAADLFQIQFDYNNDLGFAREQNNSAYGESGTQITIFAFPNEGFKVDSLTVTDTYHNRPVTCNMVGYFSNQDGLVYKFTMPYGAVEIRVEFALDTENDYHYVDYEVEGSGSYSMVRNGYPFYRRAARGGDTLMLNDVTPDTNYKFFEAFYCTPDEQKVNIQLNNTFLMPACDITIHIVFKRCYEISVESSNHYATVTPYMFWGIDSSNATSTAFEGALLQVNTDTVNYDAVVITESGNRIDVFELNSRKVFSMPAENVTVYVTFLKSSYDVTCSAENGSLDYSAPNGTKQGRTVTLEPTPDEGYCLKELYYTYTPLLGLPEETVELDIYGDLSFEMPRADVTATAVFAPARTVEWLDGDGSSILDIKQYAEGAPLPTTDKIPVKESTSYCSYRFTGWSAPSYYTDGLAVIRPQFEAVFTVLTGSCTAQPNEAAEGTLITLTPDEAASGTYFSGWRTESGDVEITGNTFTMPAHNVTVAAVYSLQEDVDVSIDLSDTNGYTGKPFTVSGSVTKNGTVLADVGGTVTVTFSSESYYENVDSYTVPVVNGVYTLNVPAMKSGGKKVWVHYSGYGRYGEALVMESLTVYDVSFAYLDGVYTEPQVKKYYMLGEALNTDNLIISIYWYDGTTEELPVTPDMVNGFDSGKTGWQTLSVVFPYNTGSELTYEVYINSPLLGDANGDNRVNVNDITAIQRHLAEIEPITGAYLIAADVNRDGTVSVEDVTDLQMFLAEFDNIPYPIGSIIVTNA